MDNRARVREFLISRRERITPAQAGLPAYGEGNRRVLLRERVRLSDSEIAALTKDEAIARLQRYWIEGG